MRTWNPLLLERSQPASQPAYRAQACARWSLVAQPAGSSSQRSTGTRLVGSAKWGGEAFANPGKGPDAFPGPSLRGVLRRAMTDVPQEEFVEWWTKDGGPDGSDKETAHA